MTETVHRKFHLKSFKIGLMPKRLIVLELRFFFGLTFLFDSPILKNSFFALQRVNDAKLR